MDGPQPTQRKHPKNPIYEIQKKWVKIWLQVNSNSVRFETMDSRQSTSSLVEMKSLVILVWIYFFIVNCQAQNWKSIKVIFINSFLCKNGTQ